MEIKIVQTPQNESNSAEQWVVRPYIYRERQGGLKLWFEMLNEVKPDIVYLYEMKAFIGQITSDGETADEILYSVRADLQKHK